LSYQSSTRRHAPAHRAAARLMGTALGSSQRAAVTAERETLLPERVEIRYSRDK